MRYFKYVNALDRFLALKIYQVVSGLEFFAMKKYKGLYQDALDATMEHVLKHYKPDSDNLEHYTMSVLSKILLNFHSKEVSSDDVYTIESDKQAVKDDIENSAVYYAIEEEGLDTEDSLKECIQYLLPFFLKDYDMFKTKKVGTRKLKYPGLFEKFRAETIAEAMDILSENHYVDAKYLASIASSTRYRRFAPDRYLASMDKTLSYEGKVNGIILCQFSNARHKKFVYCLDVVDFIDELIKYFYEGKKIASRVIAGTTVYVTLSGKEVLSLSELRDVLEDELVGSILTRLVHVKVLNYEKGKEFLVTSTSDSEDRIYLNVFGEEIPLEFQRVVAKRSY